MKTLRETVSFKLVQYCDSFNVVCKDRNATPHQLLIRDETAREPLTYSDESFDMSCVWVLGVGVFER